MPESRETYETILALPKDASEVSPEIDQAFMEEIEALRKIAEDFDEDTAYEVVYSC
jgi:hypothetical protein